MKLTAWAAAISLALSGALLAGCGQEGSGGASGGSSASGSSGSSGSMGRTPGGNASGQQDPSKRSTSPSGTK